MHKSDKIHAHTIMMHSVQALYCNWDCLRILGYFILDRVYKVSECERKAFYNYEYCTSKMVNKMCKQKNKNDSVILKRELNAHYKFIQKQYHKERGKLHTKGNERKWNIVNTAIQKT